MIRIVLSADALRKRPHMIEVFGDMMLEQPPVHSDLPCTTKRRITRSPTPLVFAIISYEKRKLHYSVLS
jgi:hypothetical protein